MWTLLSYNNSDSRKKNGEDLYLKQTFYINDKGFIYTEWDAR